MGITSTLGEYLVSQIFATYCQEHPDTHISILAADIQRINNMLKLYELDWAIIEGNIGSRGLTSLLLDTDYLCLVVSPKHKFAGRDSISLSELKKEKLILRTKNTGTRGLFENHLLSNGENVKNFHVMIEIDNVSTIKELVESNVGVTIVSHSAVKSELSSGNLVAVPIDNLNMTREINMVYSIDFKYTEMLKDIRRIYTATPPR